jgi:Na+-transporting NADH:ubiquinone oxidoreductase subunit A
MNTITIKKGLDIPISGSPQQQIRNGNPCTQVALLGDDYVGMKPTMLVQPGDKVMLGQPLFEDKKNPGVLFTSPGCGTVSDLQRGAKRKFAALVIDLDGDEGVVFCDPVTSAEQLQPQQLRDMLITSGLWPAFRTRPYGKTPAIDSTPSSLFITAIDTSPLAGDPQVVIHHFQQHYQLGLQVLRRLLETPIHYCTGKAELLACEQLDGITYHRFVGPHPAGLPSTHIHFIDPVREGKTVWHIGYQDVAAIGHLLATGRLMTERIVALGGAGVLQPALVRTRLGASLNELCRREISLDELRIVSGSLLAGRESAGYTTFLGRFHDQVSVISNSSGRSAFNWLLPGAGRFSIRPVFLSAWLKPRLFPMNTALWGGRRAIYPLGTYDEVMPLDIIATSLLKSVAKCDTEKSKALGCLELIEEDLGLCGFVCPGKNEFGADLRTVLNEIELGN